MISVRFFERCQFLDTGKAVVQSVQVVKSTGEDNTCYTSPSSDSAPKKESSVESKMIDDKKFFDFVLDCCYVHLK